MSAKATIYLLRHGEITDTDSLAGHTDFALSEVGRAELLQAALNYQFDVCISSPLQRCASIAQEVSEQRKIKLEITDAIKEMHFGRWDGLSYQTLWSQQKPNIGDFWQSPFRVTPPQGESFSVFFNRVTQWWQQLLIDTKVEKTLVITHAGVIKCILAHTLAEAGNVEQIEKLATQISIGYAKAIELSIYRDADHPPHVQINL